MNFGSIRAQVWAILLLAAVFAPGHARADSADLARWIAQGNQHFIDGNFTAASDAYEQALMIDKQSATAMYNLAMAQIAKGEADPDASSRGAALLRSVAAMPGAGELAQRAQFNLGILQAQQADQLFRAATDPELRTAGQAPTLDDAISAFRAAGDQLRNALRDARSVGTEGGASDDIARSLEYTRRRIYEAQRIKNAMERLNEAISEAADAMEDVADQQEQRAAGQGAPRGSESTPSDSESSADQEPEQTEQQREQRSETEPRATEAAQSSGDPQSAGNQASTAESESDPVPSVDDVMQGLQDARDALQKLREAREQAGLSDDPAADAVEQRIDQSESFSEQLQQSQDALRNALEQMTPDQQRQFHRDLAETYRELAEQLRDNPTPPDPQPQPDEPGTEGEDSEQASDEQSPGEPNRESEDSPASPESSEPQGTETMPDAQLQDEPTADQDQPADGATEVEAETGAPPPDNNATRQTLRDVLDREAEIREQLEEYRRRLRAPAPTRVERDW